MDNIENIAHNISNQALLDNKKVWIKLTREILEITEKENISKDVENAILSACTTTFNASAEMSAIIAIKIFGALQ